MLRAHWLCATSLLRVEAEGRRLGCQARRREARDGGQADPVGGRGAGEAPLEEGTRAMVEGERALNEAEQ